MKGSRQPVVARLEDPDHNPTLDTLERVAAALGTRLEVGLSQLRDSGRTAERTRPRRSPALAGPAAPRRKRAA